MTPPLRHFIILIHGPDDLMELNVDADRASSGPNTVIFLRGDTLVAEFTLDQIIGWQMCEPEETAN